MSNSVLGKMAQVCEWLCGDETESLYLTQMLKTEVGKALQSRNNDYLKKYLGYGKPPTRGIHGNVVGLEKLSLKQPKISKDLSISLALTH